MKVWLNRERKQMTKAKKAVKAEKAVEKKAKAGKTKETKKPRKPHDVQIVKVLDAKYGEVLNGSMVAASWGGHITLYDSGGNTIDIPIRTCPHHEKRRLDKDLIDAEKVINSIQAFLTEAMQTIRTHHVAYKAYKETRPE